MIKVFENDVHVDGIIVTDPVVADQLRDHAVDDREAMLADMIEIGARMIQRLRDGAQGELLRREVDRMRDGLELSQETSAAMFVEAMRPVLGSVAQQLTGLQGQMDGVLAVSQARDEARIERDRGTAKGRTFEEDVARVVEEVARHQGDSCEHVGDVGGGLGRSGDVLVQIDGASGAPLGRIVFEVKTGRLSKPEAIRELDRALTSRDADFAVLVVSSTDRMPANTLELHEYGGNKVVVVHEGRRGTELAYSLARARVLSRVRTDDGVDVEMARATIEQAVSSLDGFRSIKTRLTGLIGAAEEVRVLIDTLASEVRRKLDAAATALEQSG